VAVSLVSWLNGLPNCIVFDVLVASETFMSRVENGFKLLKRAFEESRSLATEVDLECTAGKNGEALRTIRL
jgi:hypothetical protein